MWIFPINVVSLLVTGTCSYYIYNCDHSLAFEKSQNLYYAGCTLQIYLNYIMVRESVMTVSHFCIGRRSSFSFLVMMHYAFACLDLIVVTILMIWGGVAINKTPAVSYVTAPEESGLLAFLNVTTLNCVLGFSYVVAHIFAMVAAFIIITFSPERFGFGPRNFDDTAWLEDDLEESGFLAATIRQRR